MFQEMSKILNHPRVYSFLHVPVQSGSDNVLLDMKREYNRADFAHVVDFLKDRYGTHYVQAKTYIYAPQKHAEMKIISLINVKGHVQCLIHQFRVTPDKPNFEKC